MTTQEVVEAIRECVQFETREGYSPRSTMLQCKLELTWHEQVDESFRELYGEQRLRERCLWKLAEMLRERLDAAEGLATVPVASLIVQHGRQVGAGTYELRVSDRAIRSVGPNILLDGYRDDLSREHVLRLRRFTPGNSENSPG